MLRNGSKSIAEEMQEHLEQVEAKVNRVNLLKGNDQGLGTLNIPISDVDIHFHEHSGSMDFVLDFHGDATIYAEPNYLNISMTETQMRPSLVRSHQDEKESSSFSNEFHQRKEAIDRKTATSGMLSSNNTSEIGTISVSFDMQDSNIYVSKLDHGTLNLSTFGDAQVDADSEHLNIHIYQNCFSLFAPKEGNQPAVNLLAEKEAPQEESNYKLS